MTFILLGRETLPTDISSEDQIQYLCTLRKFPVLCKIEIVKKCILFHFVIVYLVIDSQHLLNMYHSGKWQILFQSPNPNAF